MTQSNHEFICGPAGSGKSTLLRQRIAEDSSYAVLTATTGIAAINLGEGVTTINSLLGFFDRDSLEQSVRMRWLHGKLKKLALNSKFRHIVIDEVSMLPAEYLDWIIEASDEVQDELDNRDWWDENNKRYRPEVPKLILTGDFCQLPPIQGDFAFKADCWNRFQVTKLTKIWRQDNQEFREALNFARIGDGLNCARRLNKLGVEFVAKPNQQFDGTTLFPTNASVDKFNRERFQLLPAKSVTFHSMRMGKQKGEWKDIPQSIDLKEGALVLVLANEPRTFSYVNGDLAEVIEIMTSKQSAELASRSDEDDELFTSEERACIFDSPKPKLRLALKLRLKRNGYEFILPYLVRTRLVYNTTVPDGELTSDYTPWFDERKHAWVTGECHYMPIRLGYATTYHKSQGLTMDRLQVDIRNEWANNPAMVYVALSRLRDAKGLKIIGSIPLLAQRVTRSAEVSDWV